MIHITFGIVYDKEFDHWVAYCLERELLVYDKDRDKAIRRLSAKIQNIRTSKITLDTGDQNG